MVDTRRLEQIIAYHFQDPSKLETALTHSSYANEMQVNRRENNKRYEFLGDAVLELTVSDYLFAQHPEFPEGKLTKKRASIVCEQTLFLCAQKISLGQFLYLGKGEENTGGRKRPSVLSDAFEALIGAIYLDGGMDSAVDFINRFVLCNLREIELFYDCKTTLQELVQSSYAQPLHYRLVREEGPDHAKRFITEALLGGQVIGTGEGSTKKASEQAAAYHAILKLNGQETPCI